MAEVADSSIRVCEWKGVWNHPDGANRIPTEVGEFEKTISW